jgi:hypothetical protein
MKVAFLVTPQGQVRIELVAPVGVSSPVQRFLTQRLNLAVALGPSNRLAEVLERPIQT